MEFHSPYLIVNIFLFAVGLVVLIKGSGIFIDSASEIARIWKVSELVIGLTLVSIGTALPELAASIYAAACDHSDFVVGNVVGSIYTNITIVLGLAVVIGGSVSFHAKLLRRDAVIMNALFIGAGLCFFLTRVKGLGGNPVPGMNKICGLILLLCAGAYCYYLIRHPEELKEELPEGHQPGQLPANPLPDFIWLILGMIMVVSGSKAMVDNAVWGAEQLNIDTMIISATVVAFGTSLPELAVTLAGVFKGRHDIAVGNIIGSCIFNIMLIFGSTSLIGTLGVNSEKGCANLMFMVGCGLLLFLFMAMGTMLRRWQGVILVAAYCVFLWFNFR